MKLSILVFTILIHLQSFAQVDSALLKRVPADTLPATGKMNMDAVYSRPFLQVGKMPVTVGGYLETDYQYMGEDGIAEGHSFRIPRMTLFAASSAHRKIRFLSELELEEGGKEISIEFAALDFSFHPLLNIRGGVVMNPIGAFNQNHDGPKWEFVERPHCHHPNASRHLEQRGLWLYGRQYINRWAFGYEVYLTNGFNNSIISNSANKTFLPAVKASRERFEESSNGCPLFTGKNGTTQYSLGRNRPLLHGRRVQQV